MYMKFFRKVVNILKKYKYILKNLDCAQCAKEIEERLQKEHDLKNVSVNFSTLKLSFETTKEEGVYSYIKNIVQEVEPEVEVLENSDSFSSNSVNYQMIRLAIGVILALIGNFIKFPGYFNTLFVIFAYCILLYRTFKNALILLVRSKSINENFLITISCIGAYFVGEHMEGLMVIILYEIGKILEEKAINHSRKSIASLMDIRPDYAWLEDGTKVLPENVSIGTIIMVKPGEKIPLDGTIVEGKTHLDNSSLTGESMKVGVSVGDDVLSGSINGEGIIKVKVSCDYQNSTVSRILELVENAGDKKAKTETMVNRFSRIYTPIVLILAILVAIVFPLFTDLSYQESIYRALIFLVISCPCAIAISVPLSYFSGIGRASREGILIKGSNYLDSLKEVKEIIFDKTGTLTTGEFGVIDVLVLDDNFSREEVLDYAVLGESFSNHPVAKSILKYDKKERDSSLVKNYQEVSGKGICYQIGKKKVLIGNKNFVNCSRDFPGTTNVYVSVDGKVIGVIKLSDRIRKDAKKAIQLLKSRGIFVRMFTGDSKKTALFVGSEVEIDEIQSEMLPTDKYMELEKVMEKYSEQEKVVFVGDGINDSPVLARADIGISMGGVGTSAAIEASDVVIMTDSLLKIDRAIEISKITSRIIVENLVFAIFVKVMVLFLSTFGICGMWQAIFADVGVTLITILNTLRILRS